MVVISSVSCDRCTIAVKYIDYRRFKHQFNVLLLTGHDAKHPSLSTEPTEIIVPPEDVELKYRSKVVFQCKAKSDDSTPVTVRWLKDNVQIPYVKHRIMVNSTDFSLHIRTEDDPDQGASHEGTYTCIASNGYSEVQAVAKLTLPPGPVREYPLIRFTTRCSSS